MRNVVNLKETFLNAHPSKIYREPSPRFEVPPRTRLAVRINLLGEFEFFNNFSRITLFFEIERNVMSRVFLGLGFLSSNKSLGKKKQCYTEKLYNNA